MARRQPAPPVEALVRDACTGNVGPFRDLLLRRGGLPGPRPNLKLAGNAAAALVGQGEAGLALADEFRAMDENAAPAGSAYPILPVVGVIALGHAASRAHTAEERATLLGRLQPHAEDPRREVRDAVAAALGIAMGAWPDATLQALEAWTDGYLHAELVLRALSEPAVLQKLDEPTVPLTRLQEAFALAAGAPRAHQRSQGYRFLLRALSRAVVALGRRFPQPVTQWLEAHADVATKDLLEALNEALDGLRAAGLRAGDARHLHEALDAAVPPPRDPRWDVGPTRARGKKARRK